MNNFELTMRYWTRCIQEYVECLSEPVELTDDELKRIVGYVLEDDEIWKEIDASMEYYINKVKAGVM